MKRFGNPTTSYLDFAAIKTRDSAQFDKDEAEPQVPEGMVMLSLNLFKASAVPKCKSRRKINGGIENE